jgi:hypothetical protein
MKILVLFLMLINNSFSANVNGTGVVTITNMIKIANTSDLLFPNSVQGSSSYTLPPGSSENANNASFTITGEPSTSYQVILPGASSIIMKTAGGGALKEIIINSFASTPSVTGTLNASGTQMLYVGATRASLPLNQFVGNYTATFNVTVIY